MLAQLLDALLIVQNPVAQPRAEHFLQFGKALVSHGLGKAHQRRRLHIGLHGNRRHRAKGDFIGMFQRVSCDLGQAFWQGGPTLDDAGLEALEVAREDVAFAHFGPILLAESRNNVSKPQQFACAKEIEQLFHWRELWKESFNGVSRRGGHRNGLHGEMPRHGVEPCAGRVWRETDIRLEVLCDTNAEVTKQKAAEAGFRRAETDWRQLLGDRRIDIVSITTPNNLHREMAVAFLAAGKHVWCEKPMALTLEDAVAMTKAAAASKAKTLLGYNYIRNPALAHARKIILDGTLGRIIHFRGQVDEDYQADENVPWSWRSRLETGGLGVLGDLTCHLVSFAHYLVGDIAQVCADIDTVHKMRPVPGSMKSARWKMKTLPMPWCALTAAPREF